LFLQNEGTIMSDEYLYEKVWKQTMGRDSQALNIAVSRLRKKLSGSGYSIAAEYGEGYQFERESTESP
jgi:DNA-binding response OmpR family regulator